MEKEKSIPQSDFSELRLQAEEKLRHEAQDLMTLSDENKVKLIHELRVYQIELEMQNDELRKTQQELQKTKDQYLDLYDFAPVGYFTLSEKGVILRVNLTLADTLGVERATLLNKPFNQFVSADSQDSYYFFINQLLKERKKQSVELKLKKRDGSGFYALLESVVAENSANDSREFRVSVTDITERKQTEEELMKKNTEAQRFRRALDEVPLHIYMKDLQSRYVYANRLTLELFGCSAEELVGRDDTYFFPPDTVKQLQEIDLRVFTGESTSEEIDITGSEQHVYWEVKTPIYTGSEHKTEWGLLGISTDITERKQAEEQIKASLKEKETLLHEIHHRVKNNLTVVSSLLSLQANNMNDEKLTAVLMDSKNRVQSMSMIHETLYQSESLSSIDMNIYLSKLSRAVAQNFTIGSRTNLKIESGNIMIGAKQASPVGLIVNELITNSFKYAFPDNQEGEIKISLQELENQIELEYSDNGIGIPDGLDWKNTKSMGLNLVKILAERQLSGSINMENNNGAKFTIKFKIDNT
jgi:PAS domain S-box-containing protein